MQRESMGYFCDEAGLTDRYIAIGGVGIRIDDMIRVDEDLAEIKYSCGFYSELRWAISEQRRNCPFIQAARYLRRLVDDGTASLDMLFMHGSVLDNRGAGDARRIASLGREWTRLILESPMRRYSQWYDLYLRADEGPWTKPLVDGSAALNSFAKLRHGRGCIKTSRQVRSGETSAIQLLDVTMGALTAKLNGKPEDLSKRSTFRLQLRNEICALWGIDDFDLKQSDRLTLSSAGVLRAA